MSPQPYQLVMRTGPTPGKNYLLNKTETYIGRDPGNDIVVNDAEISRKHARVVEQGDSYIIEDLGSTNGTFVDGQRLMGPYTLRPGDLILLGENVSLAYESSEFDPDATIVSAAGPAATPPIPQPVPEFPAQQPFRPVAPPPVYSPSQPAPSPQPFTPVQPPPAPPYTPPYTPPPAPAPVSEYDAPAQRPSSGRNWLLASCGCLILLILCSAVTLYLVDYLRLWCTLFGFLIPACRQ